MVVVKYYAYVRVGWHSIGVNLRHLLNYRVIPRISWEQAYYIRNWDIKLGKVRLQYIPYGEYML